MHSCPLHSVHYVCTHCMPHSAVDTVHCACTVVDTHAYLHYAVHSVAVCQHQCTPIRRPVAQKIGAEYSSVSSLMPTTDSRLLSKKKILLIVSLITCCWYGFQVKTEWGGDAALARPSLLPSTITKTRSKLFFDLFRISPPTSPNQFIFQDKIMNKNQIEEKQCRGEHGRC